MRVGGDIQPVWLNHSYMKASLQRDQGCLEGWDNPGMLWQTGENTNGKCLGAQSQCWLSPISWHFTSHLFGARHDVILTWMYLRESHSHPARYRKNMILPMEWLKLQNLHSKLQIKAGMRVCYSWCDPMVPCSIAVPSQPFKGCATGLS